MEIPEKARKQLFRKLEKLESKAYDLFGEIKEFKHSLYQHKK